MVSHRLLPQTPCKYSSHPPPDLLMKLIIVQPRQLHSAWSGCLVRLSKPEGAFGRQPGSRIQDFSSGLCLLFYCYNEIEFFNESIWSEQV